MLHLQAHTVLWHSAPVAVLAAFASWADTNIAAGPLADSDRERIAAVCSRSRFPDIAPDVLVNYWDYFSWMPAVRRKQGAAAACGECRQGIEMRARSVQRQLQFRAGVVRCRNYLCAVLFGDCSIWLFLLTFVAAGCGRGSAAACLLAA